MTDPNAVTNKNATEVTTPETTWGGVYYTPRVDVHETEDALVFQCDMPGAKPDDIDLRFENKELILHAKIAPRHAGQWQFSEYGVGDFYRAFTINEEIKPDQIAAEYKQGVLTVHLPKKDEVKPRRIAIQS
jgi:HSP20 family protein